MRSGSPPIPEIILGPPGTGKTTTLLGIVDDELSSGTEPDRIAYLSFTRRAADEAVNRACDRFKLTRSQLTWFRTLHSLCMRRLGLRSGNVFEGDRLSEFSDMVGEPVTGRFSKDDGTYAGYERGDRMLFADNLARVRRQTLRQHYEQDTDDIDWRTLERFSRALKEFKDARGLVDYTDMLSMMVNQKQGPDLDVLLIDEAQDLSLLQWEVVWLLARTCRRVVIAGDDDQAIYRWAGADVDTLVDMPGTVRVLNQSWRVPRRVQEISDGVISRIRKRRPKEWLPRADEGQVRWIPSQREADFSGKSVLVLARNQRTLFGVMDDLRASGIFFEHHGHSSVKQTLLDAVVIWESLRKGETRTAEEVRKALDLITVGEGITRGNKTLPGLPNEAPITMSDLKEKHGLLTDAIWHDALDKIPVRERQYMIRARRSGERFSQKPRVRVDTIHASKGGEADHVILMTDMSYRTYEEARKLPDDEARVWYVGVTRAKEQLSIVAPQSRYHFVFH